MSLPKPKRKDQRRQQSGHDGNIGDRPQAPEIIVVKYQVIINEARLSQQHQNAAHRGKISTQQSVTSLQTPAIIVGFHRSAPTEFQKCTNKNAIGTGDGLAVADTKNKPAGEVSYL